MSDPAAQPGAANVVIGRLSLKLSGLSETGARRLAQLVAAELGCLPDSPGLPARLEGLKITVTEADSQDTDRLARRIAAEIIAELRRRA